MSNWTLFSNHGHVLLFVSRQPEARLRDIAERVGITERAVQKIVRDLQDGGLLSVSKHGRCNHYRIHGRKSLRHELEAHCSVAQLVQLIHPDHEALAEDAVLAQVVAAPPEAKPQRAPERKPEPKPEPKPAPKLKQPVRPPVKAPAPSPKPAAPAGKVLAKPAKKGGRKRGGGPNDQQGSLF